MALCHLVLTQIRINMPIESKQQQKAMYAAAAGKSNIGIPKKVGKEFIKAGKAKANLPQKVMKKAAGRGR